MRVSDLAAALCVAMLWVGAANAITPAQKCSFAKQKATAKKAAAKLACYAKASKKAVAVDAVCLGKAEEKFATAFSKAEAAGGCESEGDANSIEAYVDTAVAAIVAATPGGPQCAAAKQKAAGKAAAAKLKCHAKGAKLGIAADYACLYKARTAFNVAFDKADAAGGCTNTGDSGSTGTFIDKMVALVVSWPLIDNGDGTITDPRTNLMWEKKSFDGGVHQFSESYTWCANTAPFDSYCDNPGNPPDGEVFTDFLEDLNTPPCFAGYCDWRLPSEAGQTPPYTGPKELESILAPCGGGPCVAPIFDVGCTNGCTVTECSCTASGGYWSSTTLSGGFSNSVWGVSFTSGQAGSYYKIHYRAARAVRSLP